MWPTSGAKAVPLVGAALRDVIGQRKLHSTAESIRPFVLLMGWLGADAHNLAKYASLYEDYGAQVSTVRPTLAQTAIPLLSDAATLRAARHIAEEMRSHGEGPLFVQCMSNAGWIAFANLMRMCSLTAGAQTRGEAALPRRLRHAADRQALSELHKALTQTSGIVIDSAPSLATPHIWARGAVAALLRKPAQHVEVENQRMVSVAYSAAERYLALPSVSHHLRDLRSAWLHAAPLAPQLYLYSDADALIPASHIRAFIAQQEMRGVDAQSHCFPSSPHCEHLRTHPELYTRLVHNFMQRCIGHPENAANWV